MKRFLPILLLIFPVLLNASIYVLDISGPIDSITAEYITDSFARIKRGPDPALIVITIDTPGGLDTSMRSIIKDLLGSPSPVAVFVSPQGARAASAGFFITIAADIAVMSPGTNMGAASPVSALGQKIEDTMKAKITNDAVSYIKSLARKRGRNEDLAEKAVSESRSYTAEECLKNKLIEYMASSVSDLISLLDRKEVTLVSGKRMVLSLKDQPLVKLEMSWRQKFLKTITNPNLAYFLLIFGLIGLYLEFTHPGAIIPGVLGGISLLLAFLAFQVLPINYVGLLLILLAIGLFIGEIKIQGFGMLGIGGIIAFFLGSVILISSPIPEMRPTMSLIIAITVSFAVIVLFLTYKVFQAMKNRTSTGQEGLVGEKGVAKTPVNAFSGRVFVHGEWWNAVSDDPIEPGSRIEVLEMKDFVLKVKKGGN